MQIFSKSALDFKEQAKKLKDIEHIAVGGLFVALYMILYMHNIKITEIVQIRFGYFVIAAAAMYGGPLYGMTIGVLSDLTSMIVTGGQGSSYFVGFTISYALMGFFFGLAFYGAKITVPRAITGAVFQFIISIFVNTFWLHVMSGTSYWALFLSRLPKSLVMLAVTSVLFYMSLSALSHVLRSVLVRNYKG